MNNEPIPSNQGFTLIEVMIATAVLAIALTGVASVVLQANRLNKYNEEHQMAQKAATDMMEQVESRAISDEQIQNFLGNNKEFAVEGLSPVEGANRAGTITYTENPNWDPDSDKIGEGFTPVKVNVTIRWNGAMGESNFSITRVVNKSY